MKALQQEKRELLKRIKFVGMAAEKHSNCDCDICEEDIALAQDLIALNAKIREKRLMIEQRKKRVRGVDVVTKAKKDAEMEVGLKLQQELEKAHKTYLKENKKLKDELEALKKENDALREQGEALAITVHMTNDKNAELQEELQEQRSLFSDTEVRSELTGYFTDKLTGNLEAYKEERAVEQLDSVIKFAGILKGIEKSA